MQDIDSIEERLSLLVPASESELAELAEEESQARTRELRRLLNAPLRIIDWIRNISDGLHTGPWWEKMATLIEILHADNGGTIGICGGSGRGKTTLAVMVLWQATALRLSGRYTTLFGMLTEFNDARREGRLGKMLQSFALVDVLVIDQCDKASTSQLDAGAFLEIVDRRHNQQLLTILVGNGAIQDFAHCLGESIHSRINATGGMIHCDWPRFDL